MISIFNVIQINISKSQEGKKIGLMIKYDFAYVI